MSIATSYAKALYEAAKDEGQSSELLIQLENQFDSMLSILEASKEARVALLGPVTSGQEKADLVSEFSKKLGFSLLFVKFVILMARKGRLPFLKEVREAFS